MSNVETLKIEDNATKLERLFIQLSTYGMQGRFGSVWPVIIRNYTDRDGAKGYEYEYPSSFFDALKRNEEISIHYVATKKERIYLVKFALDKLMNNEIDIYLFHFAIYLIYGDNRHIRKMKEELTEKELGKKKAQYFNALPVPDYKGADDFITEVWSYQIKRWYVGDDECRQAPWMKDVRLLFSREQFSDYMGTDYYKADWVEPISGDLYLKCNTWTKEKDPMTKQGIPEGWIEGPINLGHEGGSSGLRHFVQGEPIHAGSAIQVKFGDGWISGRYEWSFQKGNPIQIHDGRDEVIFIGEGHLVRVRG